MKPNEMEEAMMKNMVKKTGKNINDWIKIIRAEKFNANSEIVNCLKKKYHVGHFYAHLIANKVM